MRASIIIAAHQEGALLGKTIESCLRVASDFEREIIVADDASSDGSVDDVSIRFPEIIVVRHPERLGVSPTKDLGARRATGDVLVFLDAHTNPDPGAVLLRLVEDVELLEGAAVVTPAIARLCQRTWRNLNTSTGHGYSLELETFTNGWLPLDKLRKADRAGRTFYESPALMGCALALSRELYDRLWGFDPAMLLWGVEDIDFSLKCWLMGHAILHDPEAVIGHRFQEAFSSYRVSKVQILASQMRMAYKNLSLSMWPEWLRMCRGRYTDLLSEQPEGFVAAAWHQFELGRESAERERIYLQARRRRDDLWYAERFDLPWPRLGTSAPAASLPLTLHPFDDPSPSPSPSCSGTLTISVNGSDPPDTGPRFICFGGGISLLATMTSGAFPSGKPVWSFLQQPDGSSISPPAAGTNPATIEPDVEGKYIIQAACDDITDTFEFVAGTVTLSEYGFTGGGKVTLTSDDGTYGDESGDPITPPEYTPDQDPSPVCYVKGTTATIEATFAITPDLGDDEYSFHIGGFGQLLKDGTIFDFDDTIVLTGTTVEHEFTLKGDLPAYVLNDQLELTWSVCDEVEVTHAMYITYGVPEGSVVTVTRMNRVTSDCNDLEEEADIVGTLWTKTAGPYGYVGDAPLPSPLWRILDGADAQCIHIVSFFDLTIRFMGIEPDGKAVYCYVDPGGGSHESTSTNAFATRDCTVGHNGHTDAVGTDHSDFSNVEVLVWDDGNFNQNNWEGCYKYGSDPSDPYVYFAEGTNAHPAYASVQAVMDGVVLRTWWAYNQNMPDWGHCMPPGPMYEKDPY